MNNSSSGEALRQPEFDKNRVNLNLNFGAHVTTKDFEGLEKELRRGGYDIYVPELVGRRTADEDLFRKIARGDTKTYQRLMADIAIKGMRNSVYAAQFGAMFGTHLNLFFADVVDTQVKEDPELGEFGIPVSGTTFTGFEDYLEACRQRTLLGARLLQKRDPIIAGNIDVGLVPFIEQHPKLSQMDEVKVLVTMGDMHSFLLPGLLEARGFDPKVTGKPEVKDLTAGEEAEVRILVGEELDERLLVETAANGVLWGHLYHPYTMQKRKIVRQLTGVLSRDVTEALFENYRRYSSVWVHKFTEGWMAKLGIAVPELRLIDPNQDHHLLGK